MAVSVVDKTITESSALYLGDSVEILKGLPSESIHYMIYSPPFASLYTYSNSERDLGNCKSRAEFLEHYSFVARELYRLLKPGRLLSFHCMNLPSTKERDGFIGIRDFRGDLIAAHDRCLNCGKPHQSEMDDTHGCSDYQGMIFHSEVCIWKDPVTAMQRTKAIGLLYKQLRKDSCLSRQGIPDYLVTMRKPGENAERVAKVAPPVGSTFAHARNVPPNEFSVDKWQEYASPVWDTVDSDGEFMKACGIADRIPFSPVWMDINPSDTLQRDSAREAEDERHICPLQLGVIQRGVELWTNQSDVVLSPFAGIGSEGYVAIKNRRRFVGVELKESYYQQARLNLATAERDGEQQSLLSAVEL